MVALCPTFEGSSLLSVRSILNSYTDFIADVFHLLFRQLIRFFRAVFEYRLHIGVCDTFAPLTHRRYERFDIRNERFFARLVLPLIGFVDGGKLVLALKETVDVVDILR